MALESCSCLHCDNTSCPTPCCQNLNHPLCCSTRSLFAADTARDDPICCALHADVEQGIKSCCVCMDHITAAATVHCGNADHAVCCTCLFMHLLSSASALRLRACVFGTADCTRKYDDSMLKVVFGQDYTSLLMLHDESPCVPRACVKAIDQRKASIDESLTNVLVRDCVCGARFIKSGGCNKITCVCGRKLCYVCKAVIDTYAHFCTCKQTMTCLKCHVYSNVEERDNEKMAKIHSAAC